MILCPFYGLPLRLHLFLGDEKLLLELSESTHDDPILRFLTLIPIFCCHSRLNYLVFEANTLR
jgi:hypothetical protein